MHAKFVLSAAKEAAPGNVRAFDVRTGELRWTFHVVPEADEMHPVSELHGLGPRARLIRIMNPPLRIDRLIKIRTRPKRKEDEREDENQNGQPISNRQGDPPKAKMLSRLST